MLNASRTRCGVVEHHHPALFATMEEQGTRRPGVVRDEFEV
jgi:hypothetical protein